MEHRELQSVPEPTLRRLPVYYRFLQKLRQQGRDVVSCTHIGQHLRLDPTQVRKDLAVTGITGKPRVGYELPALMDAIERFLGWNNTQDVFLVGAGNLGRALIGYEGFRRNRMNIVAAFDNDPAKVGTTIRDKPVMALEKMVDLAGRMGVQIGILAVPAETAQDVAGLMVLSGIRAIWNFAPVRLDVPESVVVENVDLSASLAVLSSRLAEMHRAEQ